MRLSDLKEDFPSNVFSLLEQKNFVELRPSQVKSVKAGLFSSRNLLVCTPTASGKTLVAEMGFLNCVLNLRKKAVYVVPLRALASEKFYSFKKHYPSLRIGLSTGELDSDDKGLGGFDVVIVTSEKFDSLLRHRSSWLKSVGLIVVDEIHLLNDQSRGPTLEVVLAIIKKEFSGAQIIGLSATIGNAKELAEWLDAGLVIDSWRPVRLKKGVYLDGELHFKE